MQFKGETLSIALGIIAIVVAVIEARKSARNYKKTKSLLDEISKRAELIDRTVLEHQAQLGSLLNKALDRIGQPPIDLRPISSEEIDAILYNNEPESLEVENKYGTTTIIGKRKEIKDIAIDEIKHK